MMQKILLLPAFCLALAFAPVANAWQNPLDSRLSRVVEYQLMDWCINAKAAEVADEDFRVHLCACALKKTTANGLLNSAISDDDYLENPTEVRASLGKDFKGCKTKTN